MKNIYTYSSRYAPMSFLITNPFHGRSPQNISIPKQNNKECGHGVRTQTKLRTEPNLCFSKVYPMVLWLSLRLLSFLDFLLHQRSWRSNACQPIILPSENFLLLPYLFALLRCCFFAAPLIRPSVIILGNTRISDGIR